MCRCCDGIVVGIAIVAERIEQRKRSQMRKKSIKIKPTTTTAAVPVTTTKEKNKSFALLRMCVHGRCS